MSVEKLLLLGGTRNMQEILDEARRMGYFVGITDWYDTKRSPIKLLADAAHDVSITDSQKMDELIRNNGYRGVLTGYTDSYLPTYAQICRRNNLPCYGEEKQFRLLTDKNQYKKMLLEYSVPTLPLYTVSELAKDPGLFPVIFKPKQGSGGVGLKIFRNLEELKTVPDMDADDYLIEPYITERLEMTGFFLLVNGDIRVSGTANRILSAPQGEKVGLPILYSFPSRWDQAFREVTAPPAIEMFKDLGLKDGMVFTQCIIRDGIPQIYDIGYRLTGTLEYKLFHKVMGINPLTMMIEHAMTGTMTCDPTLMDRLVWPKDKIGFNMTVLGKPGTIGSMVGEEEIRRQPEILDVAFKMREGETIRKEAVGTLAQIMVRIFFTAEDLNDAKKTMDKIYELLKIRSASGEDMILERVSTRNLAALTGL